MPNGKRTANERGPQVSARLHISNKNLEDLSEDPAKRLAKMSQSVVFDLIDRVGYQNKITVNIEPLPEHHPEAPGMQVYARTRLK